jgi:acyl-CoA synthetase (AMP-forming)/AMP-acid ligase II
VTDTLGGWLERAARREDRGLTFLDRHERERRIAWTRLCERAERVAGGLVALGVAPGERVALAFPTGEGFLAALLGAWCAGAVPAPLAPPTRLGNPGEQQRRLRAMVAAAAPRLVLADPTVGALVGESLDGTRPSLGVVALDELPATSVSPVASDDDAPGLVQFSSGTTGAPKPIVLSRRALAVQARLLNALWPEGSEARVGEDRGFSWLPLHHDMGLVGCVVPALERAADLTLLPPEAFVARPALWLRGIARAGATISPAPTFAYGHATRRIRDEELEGVDLSTWRLALCGAEAVVPATLDAFARRFARWGFRAEALTAVYGLAEAGLAVTFGALGERYTARRFDRRALVAGRAVEDAGGRPVAGVGRPLPGFTVAIRDDEGRTLPAGRIGAVAVRGPSLMSGYLDDAAATSNALADGWLATGDLGFLDATGELFLVGRSKDVVIVRGRNHAPEEIEDAVAAVPGVRAGGVAAVGFLPETAAEEELLLLVERARGGEVDGVAALATACREAVLARVGIDAATVAVLPPGALPRTSSGKLRRGEALRRWLAGELPAAAGTGDAPGPR